MRMVDGLFTSDHLLVVRITELEEAGEVERRRVEDDGSSTDAEIPFYKEAGRHARIGIKNRQLFLWPFAVSNG